MKLVSTTEMAIKLREADADLNQWERGFMQTIAYYVTTRELTRLTDKQVEKLEEIYKRHFS